MCSASGAENIRFFSFLNGRFCLCLTVLQLSERLEQAILQFIP